MRPGRAAAPDCSNGGGRQVSHQGNGANANRTGQPEDPEATAWAKLDAAGDLLAAAASGRIPHGDAVVGALTLFDAGRRVLAQVGVGGTR